MTELTHDDDRVAQYVAGSMRPEDIEMFEQHLLVCQACQDAVRIGAATRSVLRADRPRAVRRMLPPVAWLAMAAGIVVALVATRREPGNALGIVEPAPFIAGALRPAPDSVTALIDRGMTAYAAAEYEGAVRHLTQASRFGDVPAVQFFLGVSLLMRGEEDDALVALRRVPPDGVYGEEALYFMAKALVRLNHADSALVLLERAPAAAVRLRAFADSLRHK